MFLVVSFWVSKWTWFLYLDKPSDNNTDKTRKIHDDYIFDFVFDDSHIKNTYLLDKKRIVRNKVRVIKRFEQTSSRLVYLSITQQGVAIQCLKTAHYSSVAT
jgi:type I restriction enzyme R subunit